MSESHPSYRPCSSARFVYAAIWHLLVISQVAAANDVTRWSATSENGRYEVTVSPLSGSIEIGKVHQWIVNVSLPDGAPVYPARILVGGGMQGHGHGLPTQPQVTSYGGDGDYLIEGVRFNMEGEWRLSFHIQSEHGSDRADLDIVVTF